jgi:exodeoxyribonuclease VII small subunit
MSEDVKNLSFEEALAELESIISKMESGEARLADSVALYERGVELRNRLDSLLSDAKMKIEKIQLGGDSDRPEAVPFDVE